MLLAQRESQSVERQRAAQLWSEEGWVFGRRDWSCGQSLNRLGRLEASTAAADVRDGRLHDARHTAATELLLLGVHERTIMSVLGWSTTAMASRYTHVITPIHNDLASRLDGLLWSSKDAPNGTKCDHI
jgi:integrase